MGSRDGSRSLTWALLSAPCSAGFGCTGLASPSCRNPISTHGACMRWNGRTKRYPLAAREQDVFRGPDHRTTEAATRTFDVSTRNASCTCTPYKRLQLERSDRSQGQQ
jgi:hypothetical protein